MLHCPWDPAGKNTGVGCHFPLQCMKVKSESEDGQACLTIHYPMDCSPPGSAIHGIFQARVLEWGAIAFSKALTRPKSIQDVMICRTFTFTISFNSHNYLEERGSLSHLKNEDRNRHGNTDFRHTELTWKFTSNCYRSV